MPKEKTRQQILHTASMLFAEHGFADTSMNDIVRESGLSKGGIYWHFKSKDELIAAVFDQYFVAQIDILIALKHEDGSVRSRILDLIRGVGEGIRELDGQFPQPLDFYAHAIHQPELMKRLQHYFLTYKAHLTDLIQQGVDRGEFSTPSPGLAAHILLSSIEGLILVHAFTGSNDNLESQLTIAVAHFLQGLERSAD